MQRITHAAVLAFAIVSLAMPLKPRQNNAICARAGLVNVTASGAAEADDILAIVLDDEWHDVHQSQALAASSVTWPGFPTIQCSFQGIDTAVSLQNENNINSQVTFDVGPPQALASAKCSCG